MVRIGCVSFLNARPLIDGLDGRDDLSVRYDVPSGLLADLESGEVDLALCPVIDYQRSTQPLVVVPAGGIGCKGPTLTVRLFSRRPFDQVTRLAADTDSHTSVALARVILRERFGVDAAIDDFDARHARGTDSDTMLLIGDKVVTAAPPECEYPHTLDLGQAWHEATGLPFVFAVWMARRGAELGDVPRLLAGQRARNAGRIDAIAQRHAPPIGWPIDVARQYLGHLLRYRVGARELQAMQLFWSKAAELGLRVHEWARGTKQVEARIAQIATLFTDPYEREMVCNLAAQLAEADDAVLAPEHHMLELLGRTFFPR